MIDKIKGTILKYSMIEKGDTVIAGLSGGADSVCLLYCLNILSRELGFSLVGAHLNHMIRGEEAKRDEDFARELCEKLSLKFHLKYADIPALSKGRSTEEAGREERYKFFREVAGLYPNGKIAVAHNMNDLAETMIMRMARGTSLQGAGGIKCKNGDIIRPLLFVGRNEIEEYLKKEDIPFMTDSTNLSDDYTRNKIRHNILPQLEGLNGEYLRAMANTSERLFSAAEFMEYEKDKQYGEITDEIELKKFSPLHKALKEYIVSKSAYHAGIKELSGKQIDDILRLAESESGKRIQLPGFFEAMRVYDKLIFRKRTCHKDYRVRLREGINYIEEADYTVVIKKSERGIDLSKTGLPLYARPRREGDTISPKGMDGKKKIKTLFNDEKIGADKRDRYPLVESEGKVIFALGRCDKEVISDNNTKEAFVINIYEGKI